MIDYSANIQGITGYYGLPHSWRLSGVELVGSADGVRDIVIPVAAWENCGSTAIDRAISRNSLLNEHIKKAGYRNS